MPLPLIHRSCEGNTILTHNLIEPGIDLNYQYIICNLIECVLVLNLKNQTVDKIQKNQLDLLWPELCPLPNARFDLPTPRPQNGTVFRDKAFKEVTKLK